MLVTKHIKQPYFEWLISTQQHKKETKPSTIRPQVIKPFRKLTQAHFLNFLQPFFHHPITITTRSEKLSPLRSRKQKTTCFLFSDKEENAWNNEHADT